MKILCSIEQFVNNCVNKTCHCTVGSKACMSTNKSDFFTKMEGLEKSECTPLRL